MIRRIIPAFLVLLMMLAVSGPALTEETNMEEKKDLMITLKGKPVERFSLMW